MTNEQEQMALERLIQRTLRGQPSLHAPATLQARVLAEIGDRAARPWWQQGFLRWPLLPRVAFLLVCAGLVKTAIGVTAWLIGSIQAVSLADVLPVSQLETAGRVFAPITRTGAFLFESIPMHWLIAVAFAGVTLYAAFFGLGAAAYRTLYK